MTIHVAQVLLAALLFMLVNWIGKHSIASGYHQLSLFAKVDEAPAFNFLFRVLAPTVFLVVTAALFYWMGLDEFVVGYYRVAIYYVLLRWLFNLLVGRARLLNWASQLGVASATCVLAFFVDKHLIATRQSLLPDPASLGNELWLLVIVFLFQAANQLRFSQEGTIRRKDAYLRRRFTDLRARFGKQVTEVAGNDRATERLAYAVMIYETFNRPPIYQAIERYLIFPFKKPTSLGPMQVLASERISDEESVLRGVARLSSGLALQPDQTEYMYDRVQRALHAYNVRSDYVSEVFAVYEKLGELDPFKGMPRY